MLSILSIKEPITFVYKFNEFLASIEDLDGESCITAISFLKKFKEKSTNPDLEIVISALISLIQNESRKSLVEMRIFAEPIEFKKKKVTSVAGSPPKDEVIHTRPTGFNTNYSRNLYINFGDLQLGKAGKDSYPKISSWKMTQGKSPSIELNSQGWVDDLPERYKELCMEYGNSLYFPISDFSSDFYKGRRAIIDGLNMVEVRIRGVKANTTKKGKAKA